MLNRLLLPASLFLLTLPACVQQQLDVCTLEEVRFSGCERAERRATLVRLMELMEEREPSCERDADELAEQSLLVIGRSPAAFLEAEELEQAEEAYLELEEEARIRLAADVMHALLSSPARSLNGRPHRGYGRLDVSPFLADAGEFFKPCGDECIDSNRIALFKRMAARIMLEDIACNPAPEADLRCAAVLCLQYICREGLNGADGSWENCYMIDALPFDSRNSALERALLAP